MYAEFEQLRDAAIAGGRIAGAVALTVDRGGVTYQSAAGHRAAGGTEAMTADTVFWVASMTKAIASVAALQLVERGKLCLDAPLSKLLPDLENLDVFDGPVADGVVRLRPARGEVTLRQLLTHTSGFGYGWIDPRIDEWVAATGGQPQTSGLRSAHRQPLLFDPGQGWAYGIGIDWAGIAVEAASGQRLDAYLAEHFLGPLQMTDTTFLRSAEQQGRSAAMHARTPDGGLVEIPFGLPPNPEVLSGGGGLHTTAGDYGRFLRMLLNGGELEGVRVLSPQTVAMLGEVQTGPMRAGAWTSANPAFSPDFDLFPAMHTGWGLATMITPEVGPNGRSAGALSWAGIANCYYWADQTAGKAGLVLTQLLPFSDPEVLNLLGALERCVYA